MFKKSVTMVVVLLALSVILVACQAEPEVVEVTRVVTETVTEIVEQEGETVEVQVEVTRVVTEEVVVEVEVEVPAEPEVAGPREVGRGDILTIGIPSDITTLNNWANLGGDDTYYNFVVLLQGYPTLFQYAAPGNQWVPFLAADFPTELEEEGDFWVSTVSLREGFMWSDGTDVTANDIAFTADVVIGMELTNNWASNYDADFLDHVEVVDDYTAKLVYHAKPGLARHQFGVLLASIMPAHFWAAVVDPLMAEMEALVDPTPADLEPGSDEYAAFQEESEEFATYVAAGEDLRNALKQADPAGEPTAGGYGNHQWEVGAFVESGEHSDYADRDRSWTFYSNGAISSSQAGDEYSAYGDASGDVDLEYTEGPYFDKILYQVYSTDAMILALANGEIDVAWTPLGFQQGQIEQLQRNPDVNIVTNPSNGVRYMAFNFALDEWNDDGLRSAINCIVNKDFLANDLLQGAAIPVYTMVPEGNAAWFNQDVPVDCGGFSAQERFEEAISRLTAAGYSWETPPAWNEGRGGSVDRGSVLIQPDGTPFPEMELLAPSAGYDPLRATAGVFVEQWLQDLGLPITARLTNFNNIVEVVFGGLEWDLYILGWGLTLYPDYVCDFFQTTGGTNVLNFSDAEFDAVCDLLLAETDLNAAREQVFEAQVILAEKLPYITLFTTPISDAYNAASMEYAYTVNLDGVHQTQWTQIQNVID
jgi:ABC-type transport system substrate-binding protein